MDNPRYYSTEVVKDKLIQHRHRFNLLKPTASHEIDNVSNVEQRDEVLT